MVKRKKKAKPKAKSKKAKPVLKRLKPPALEPVFIVEKESPEIPLLLGIDDTFYTPSTNAASVKKFPTKKEAEAFLATTFPGDFSVRAVPFSHHYALSFDLAFEAGKFLMGYSTVRLKNDPPPTGFRAAVKLLRARMKFEYQGAKKDLKSYERDAKRELFGLAVEITVIEKQREGFEKVAAKYGA